ncbi:MAG: efflux RND transporter periplasmic adaptor subunit [Verrucomicrobia bacterium]|nr:efflux RND transporter periplasmic adaptor subunit [Verrucomicrobiota bacterium]
MRGKRILIGLAVVLVGGGLVALVRLIHGGGPVEAEEATPTIVSVQTGHLQRMTLRGYVSGFGTVSPAPAVEGQSPAMALVAPSVPGVVREADVVAGQQVRQGDTLVVLDTRAAAVALERARRAVEFARQTAERQRELFAAHNTSARNLQDAEAQLAIAQADLAAARTQVALLRITAPLSGTVTRLDVRPGEAVDLTTTVAEIIDLERLVVQAEIPSAEAKSLKAGQPVQVLTEPPVATALAYVSPAVDATNNTVRVRVPLPTHSGLRPGEFVRLRVVTAEHANCLAAPAASVVQDEAGRQVVAVVKGEEAAQVPVTTGLREGGWVEVQAQGLTPDATVVTVGAYGLPQQTKIRVTE